MEWITIYVVQLCVGDNLFSSFALYSIFYVIQVGNLLDERFYDRKAIRYIVLQSSESLSWKKEEKKCWTL